MDWLANCITSSGIVITSLMISSITCVWITTNRLCWQHNYKRQEYENRPWIWCRHCWTISIVVHFPYITTNWKLWLIIEMAADLCNLHWFFSKVCPTQEDSPCIQIGEAIKGTFVQHCLQHLQTYLPQTLEGRPTLLQQTYLPQTLKGRPTLMQPIWPPATILP